MEAKDNSSKTESKKATLIDSLYVQIEAAAKNCDFKLAEETRNKLITAAPSALAEIIGSAKIIENEKSANLDATHMQVWNKLYSTLSQEETNCLFYSMKKLVLPEKKMILAQDSYNTRLFFKST